MAPLDDLPVSLDSRAWLGDIGLVLAFNRQNEAGRLEGVPMEARLSTGEFSPYDGWRFSPKELRPVIHSEQSFTSMSVWAEYHNVEWSPHKTTTPRPPNALGWVPLRLEARYQRYFAEFVFPEFFEAKGFSLKTVRGGFR